MSEALRSVRGFVAGALASTALMMAACATGGARSRGTVRDEAAPAQAAPAAEATAAEAPGAEAPAALESPSAPAPASTPSSAQAAPADASGAAAGEPSAAAAAGPGDSPVATYLADAQALGRASQLFRAVCTGYCHSTQPTADRVAPNLFDCSWDHGSADEAVFQSIAAGIPDTQMQGFGERLPSEDLWKIVAYLRQRSTCQ
jgi:mono/diheme cytochrome c family protein